MFLPVILGISIGQAVAYFGIATAGAVTGCALGKLLKNAITEKTDTSDTTPIRHTNVTMYGPEAPKELENGKD